MQNPPACIRHLFLSFILFTSSVISADTPKRISGAEIERSDRYLLPSKIVNDNFRIDVIRPIGYNSSTDHYPVIYVTDANYLLPSAAASYLAQATNEFPKVIIVGIGWDVPSITRIRVRDFTPTCDRAYLSGGSLQDAECGKADNFVKFIESELKPFIDNTYRTNNDDTLVGYSFGGLFALHVLFNHTHVFDHYLIGSASMGWDNQFVFKAETAYAKANGDLAKTLYLSAGGLEKNRTVSNTYVMHEKLQERQYKNLKSKLEVLPDESHMTSINGFVMRGLRFVLVDSKQ